MTNTLAGFLHFAATHPKPHQGGTWNQRCEQLVNNAGAFPYSFDNAYLAALASGHLDTDHTTARPGEFHYWSSRGKAPGHVALQTDKGLLMASNAIIGFVGTITWQAFKTYKPTFKYMGHSYRHGPLTLSGFDTASTGDQVIVSPPTALESESDMHIGIVHYKDGSFHPFLIKGDGTYSELGKKTLADWRDGEEKHKGPLGREFTWEGDAWQRVRASLTPGKPATDATPAGLSQADIDAVAGATVNALGEKLSG